MKCVYYILHITVFFIQVLRKPFSVKMVIKEDRELRNAAQKCIEGEMRAVLLEGLVKKNLGLKEVEDFVEKERGKLR